MRTELQKLQRKFRDKGIVTRREAADMVEALGWVICEAPYGEDWIWANTNYQFRFTPVGTGAMSDLGRLSVRTLT